MATKDNVLAALLNTEEELSGETLAERLGVSRTAVWKAVEQLRADGYMISAIQNRGYRLIPGQDVLDPKVIELYRHGGDIGNSVEFYTNIDSTNRRAKELAVQGAPHGLTVLADSQTAGRGRFQRAFDSPLHGGIYISFVLRPKLAADRAVMLTPLAALAVARAVERVAEVKCDIKWVNDVYIGKKKICGILCEAGLDFESGSMDYVVMGIGINVASRVFEGELANIATTVADACGHAVDRNRLCAALMDELNIMYPQLGTAAFMDEYRARSNVLGRNVLVLRGDERYPARAEGIDNDGSLIVRREDGTLVNLHSGEISLKFL